MAPSGGTMAPGRSLAASPAPPVLRLVVRTAWAECRWSAVAFLGVNLVKGLTPAAQVALTARLLDLVLRSAHASAAGFAAALPAALGLIGVTLLRATLAHLDIPLQERLSFDLHAALDGRRLEAAARSPLALFDRDDWYALVQAAGTSAGTAAEKVIEQVAWLLNSATTVAAVGVLLAAAAWWLPLGLLAGTLPTALWELWQGDRQRRYTLTEAPDQRLLGYLASLLAGEAGEGEAAEVRLYGLAGHLLRRWRNLFSRLGAAQAGFQAVQAAAALPVRLLRLGVFFGGLVVLGLGVLHGRIAAGSFMALAGGLSTFNQEAGNAAAAVRRIRVRTNALADFARLAAAAGSPPGAAAPPTASHAPRGSADVARRPGPHGAASVTDRLVPAGSRLAPGQPFPRPLREGIVFDRVTFSYASASRPALRDLSLTLRAGECLALVGANGAGKSTLVKLLLGLYAPDSGRILADGHDLAALEPAARRTAFAPVFQDHLHLQFTVAEAIGFGALPAFLGGEDAGGGRARLERAARAARAADFIASLPRGYDTPLGRALDDRGTDLSGGQWQRLATARALYAEPEVLVLDEPAAALDPQAEVELYAQFSGLAARGRTTLLVTHRLGAARIADRVAVLDGGRIAEEGTHGDLLAAGGLYAGLWAAQAGWYQ